MHCLSDASLNETLYGESAGQGEVTVIKRTVFFVSDQTGITAETMGHSLMTQFDGIEFRQVTVPFISTVDKAIEAVRKIDLVAAQEGMRPVVFSTLVQEDVRNVVRGSTGFLRACRRRRCHRHRSGEQQCRGHRAHRTAPRTQASLHHQH